MFVEINVAGELAVSRELLTYRIVLEIEIVVVIVLVIEQYECAHWLHDNGSKGSVIIDMARASTCPFIGLKVIATKLPENKYCTLT